MFVSPAVTVSLRLRGMPKIHRRPARLLKACCSSSTVVKHFPSKISATAFRLSMKAVRTKIEQLAGDCICITSKGKPIKPKTIGQKRYCSQIAKNTVTIGVGPAGTGKTYLAVAMAVTAFRSKQINRIILTRPAVEAGEKLGFLPGDLQSKVDPYLRPLYDACPIFSSNSYHKRTTSACFTASLNSKPPL